MFLIEVAESVKPPVDISCVTISFNYGYTNVANQCDCTLATHLFDGVLEGNDGDDVVITVTHVVKNIMVQYANREFVVVVFQVAEDGAVQLCHLFSDGDVRLDSYESKERC